jgi:hypothetical protein
MNLRCYLFGHDAYEHGPEKEKCARCQSINDPYDYENEWTFFQRYGVIEHFRFAVSSIIDRMFPCCCHCGKLLWFRRLENTSCCSEQCAEENIPF